MLLVPIPSCTRDAMWRPSRFPQATPPFPLPTTNVPTAVSSSSASASDAVPIPGVCYERCNDAAREVQRVGRVPQLCDQDSAFRKYMNLCLGCLNAAGASVSAIGPAEEMVGYCVASPAPLTAFSTASTASTSYTIPTSWLTTSTMLSYFTFSGVGLDGIETLTTSTSAVEVVVTRSDWTGFVHTSTPTANREAQSTSGSTESETSTSNNKAWIAGAVVGSIAGLAVLVGIYCYLLFFFRRRKRRSRKSRNDDDDEPYTGKPELHAESLPGAPRGPPKELDAMPRPPQELEVPTKYYAKPGRLPPCLIAEMPANEIPAREMDVKVQHSEMDVESEKGTEQTRQ
ncbi:uncharacterized protein B0T15DRAFT_544495 [Chaetomium strumarium]|uniref:Uncharacterized protein n=1 Tax=Chaetomium strumarium TaxID=1170767 RepID=A0AAJ0LXZ3_9PEZI|nr:hypothetical protein B0T15DRAFT_544495 [Chaetomium strumarium]